MFVDFLWSVKIFIENGHQQDGVVLGPLPSGLASSHVLHQMNTNCHTPVADLISGAWLDIMDMWFR